MAINIGNTKGKLYLGSKKVKLACLGATKVYSSGSNVTYYVDSGTSYTVEYDEGASVLSPTTFTPSKTGWTFIGWREDTTASSSVLTSKTMGDSPITLYAVFKQAVTVTYYNNSTTAAIATDYKYYNYGNTANPKFTLAQASRSGWSPRGWSTSNAGNATVTYNNNTAFTRDSNVTLYGMYSATVTVTYYNNSTTAKTTTGTMYYAPAGTIGASFTLTQATKSGWTARGWSTTNSGTATATYSSGVAFTRTSDCTLYGMYQQTITLSYNGNGSTSGSTTSQTGYVYWAPAGTIAATFILADNGFTKTDYNFTKWAQGSANGTQYAVGDSVTLTASTTFYAVWESAKIPDETVSVSLNYGYGVDDAYFGAGTRQTLGTFYTGIDKSKYSGVELTLSRVSLNTSFMWADAYLYLTDGTTSVEIGHASMGENDEYYIYTTNLNPKLNFADSSGTANLSIVLYAEDANIIGYAVYGGTLKLIGRTNSTPSTPSIPAGLVYEASYINDYSNYILSSENLKDTTYVTTATCYNLETDRGEEPPYEESGSKRILTLTDKAAVDYKYADVVVGVAYNVSYGDLNIKLNGASQVSISYGFSDPYPEVDKTITLTLSSTKTIDAVMNLVNRYALETGVAKAAVAVKSVKLYS